MNKLLLSFAFFLLFVPRAYADSTAVIASGESLDGGTATVDAANEGIFLPRGTDCSAATGEGQECWDTDDDKHYIGDGSTAQLQTPAAGAGDITDVWDCASGDCQTLTAGASDSMDAGAASDFEIPNGAAPTVNVAGEIAIDTTGDQLIYYGGAKRVLNYTYPIRITIESPNDADNILIAPLPYAITITAITCLCDPGDSGESIILTVQERDADGDNPAGVDGATTITCGNTDTNDDGSLSNPSIDANDYMSFDVGTVTGTVSQCPIGVYYTIDAT
jgi:hypothetical protein